MRRVLYITSEEPRRSKSTSLICSVLTALYLLAVSLPIPLFGQETLGNGPFFNPPTTGLAVETDGNLIVIDARILRVDPVTGDRMIVSDNTTGGHWYPFDLAIEADGDLVVVNPYQRYYGPIDGISAAVLRVDPVTGDRMIVSDDNTGNGPDFSNPLGLAIEADGSLVVIDAGRDAVLRVDPISGNRTIVSDDDTGNGPYFSNPRGLAVEADGGLVVINTGSDAVLRVDPISGDRAIISDDNTGSGPSFLEPSGLAVEADGNLVIVDSHLSRRAVLRVDPVTGNRSIVSDDTTGSNLGFMSHYAQYGFDWLRDVEVEADGNLVVLNPYGVADAAIVGVLRVDPVTGDRSFLSFSAIGTSIEEEVVPERFSLAGAYPNPFQSTTRIGYALPRPSAVELVVYDAVGRQVDVLVSTVQPVGPHEVSFEAEGLPNGVYFYRFTVGSFSKTGQMVLFR